MRHNLVSEPVKIREEKDFLSPVKLASIVKNKKQFVSTPLPHWATWIPSVSVDNRSYSAFLLLAPFLQPAATDEGPVTFDTRPSSVVPIIRMPLSNYQVQGKQNVTFFTELLGTNTHKRVLCSQLSGRVA